MSHGTDREMLEASLIGHILSLEVLLLVMGVVSLTYGLIERVIISIFLGVVIVTGAIVLHKVRKKELAKNLREKDAEMKSNIVSNKKSVPIFPGENSDDL